MMHALGSTLRDERDRSLLLLGFAGAFRSSELVSLNTSDITVTSAGMRVGVRGSKDVPLSKRVTTEVLRARNELLCAVTALESWLTRLPDANGALFRTVCGSRVTGERLAPRAVSRAVQRAAARAQLTTEYSSHSLRSGLATSAHAQGRSARDIQIHGRWKDSRSLDRYLSASPAPARNDLAGVL
jgi:integrase